MRRAGVKIEETFDRFTKPVSFPPPPNVNQGKWRRDRDGIRQIIVDCGRSMASLYFPRIIRDNNIMRSMAVVCYVKRQIKLIKSFGSLFNL